MNWVEDEMKTINLGDESLNNRLKSLLNALSQSPLESIPVACGGWAETKAAYRFFDNKNVTAEKVLSPHIASSLERIKQHAIVLLIQDTTTLNFGGQLHRNDTGPLNHENSRGILLHPTIAVTPERLCLGILDTFHWARDKLHQWKAGEKNRENHKIPIKNKESYQWLESYRKAQAIAKQVPETLIISVADREGDLYDIYHEANIAAEENKAYWLIRAKTNRRLLDKHDNLREEKLIETVKNNSPIGYIEFEIPARNNQKQRQIKQAIYVGKVRLNPPDRKRKRSRYQIIETNVVIASEINVPKNETAQEWVLLTNVSINNPQQAYDMVKWYLCRWQIEVYFRVLKSGCKIEKLQLETKERFDACLTIYMIIAWRIIYLTLLARECPDIPCNIVFTEEEWKIIYIMTYKKKPPKKLLSLSEMINRIAQFGGYLNRKNDIEPGPTALWIGLQRMRDFILASQSLSCVWKETYG